MAIGLRNMTTGFSDSGRWQVIPLSLLAAMLLTVMPYPTWMQFAIPHWVSLVLFYWCLALPERVGVGVGWVCGLVMDLLLHTLFGVNAIALAFVALVAVSGHRRLRMYHLWQQCLVIFVVCVIEIAFIGWIFKFTNNIELRLIYWQAALTSALTWPVIYTLLRLLRQRSGISRAR